MNADALAEARKSLSALGAGKVETAEVEITDNAAVEAAAVRTAAGSSGRIDILVHSAGISGPTMPLADYPPAEWKRILDIDLYGPSTSTRPWSSA